MTMAVSDVNQFSLIRRIIIFCIITKKSYDRMRSMHRMYGTVYGRTNRMIDRVEV
jgi:hypothetical protein